MREDRPKLDEDDEDEIFSKEEKSVPNQPSKHDWKVNNSRGQKQTAIITGKRER